MLPVILLLLVLGFFVRYKWKNAAAMKDEILRLVAMNSQEEQAIAKLQDVQDYGFSTNNDNNGSPVVVLQPVTPPRVEKKRHNCAVCYSLATTRCSQCKAVRYCSGKCQIIHWRQGHKDDCRQGASMISGQEHEHVTGTAIPNQFEMHLNSGQKICFDITQEHDDSGSSSSSLPFFNSSTEQSETSFDASSSEVFETGTPVKQDITPTQTISDSENADIPNTSVVYPDSSNLRPVKMKKTLPTRTDVIRSKSVKGSSNHQIANGELKSSHCSKSLKASQLDDCWQNEALLCNDKETRSNSIMSSSSHAMPSEIEGVRMFSQPTTNGLKTSVRKFVHHFRAPRQSKNLDFGTGKAFTEIHNQKVIFPVKLFMQLYSCDSIEVNPFGIANSGNSCYANAVLQCLTFTRPFTSYLLQGFHTNSCCKRDWCFMCEFESLVCKGQETNMPLSPVKIMSQIPMNGSHLSHGREEDAHEFLRNVVDKMQSIFLEEAGISGSCAEESSLVGMTFGGYLRSKIQCMKCFEKSEQFDRMMDLTVEIDGSTYTLEQALAQFTSSEILGGDDKYMCSRCKSYEKAKKKLTVFEAPNILTVVLKRFQSGNLEKLNKLVRFPEFLNLGPYMSGVKDKHPPIYNLYAVVVHVGMSAAYSGHYVSYVKDLRGNWFKIDDSRVTRVDLETVLSVEAYILFYSRRTPRIGFPDGKLKRSIDAIPSSNSAKKKNSKTKSGPVETTVLTQQFEKHHHWMSTNDFSSNHEGFAVHLKHRNSIWDSSSECSSIFSTSDAGSYSTDSTKDSSAEEISGYLFGASWYQP